MSRFLIGLVVGLGVGGAVGYFVTKHIDEDYINEEMRKVKEYYAKEDGKAKEAKEEVKEKADDATKEVKKRHIPDKPLPKEYKNLTRSYAADDGIDRDELKKEDDAPDEYYEDPAEEERPSEDRPDIEIIDISELGEKTGYDQSCVIYYTEDETYAYEDNEEMIMDPKYLFDDSVEDWAHNDDEKSNIFVRNNRISTDFEVCKCFGSFGDLNAD